LRKHARGALAELLILRRGNRLSVTPLTRDEWRFITSLA
jgi:predicted RNA-binding protein with PUA-like domain